MAEMPGCRSGAVSGWCLNAWPQWDGHFHCLGTSKGCGLLCGMGGVCPGLPCGRYPGGQDHSHQLCLCQGRKWKSGGLGFLCGPGEILPGDGFVEWSARYDQGKFQPAKTPERKVSSHQGPYLCWRMDRVGRFLHNSGHSGRKKNIRSIGP